MNDFIAIDFETGNPQRVSVCALGYAKVSGCEIVESKCYLIKPVGGHASFQSKIHGIKEEHTFDKPEFGEFFPGKCLRNPFFIRKIFHVMMPSSISENKLDKLQGGYHEDKRRASQ